MFNVGIKKNNQLYHKIRRSNSNLVIMKKITVLFLLFGNLFVFGQGSSTDNLDLNSINTVVTDDSTTIKEEEGGKLYDGHWAGFDIGATFLFTENFGSDFNSHQYWDINPLRSTTFSFNFYDYKLPIIKQYLGLTTGIGWNVTGFGLRDNYDIVKTSDSLFGVVNTAINYRNNSLNVHYLTLPLLIEFASKKHEKKNLYLNFGVIGGWRIFSNSLKTGKNADGDRFRNELRSNYHFAPFTLEATVRAGYSLFGVYASYNLTPLFRKETTIAMYPMRVGITFNMEYPSK
ncbi:MAG: hypothetical protein RL264_2005 [Bacteroidota bacterium]